MKREHARLIVLLLAMSMAMVAATAAQEEPVPALRSPQEEKFRHRRSLSRFDSRNVHPRRKPRAVDLHGVGSRLPRALPHRSDEPAERIPQRDSHP